MIGDVQPGGGSAGFIDQWVNPGLETQDGGSTLLGFGGSVSRVFQILAGQNAVYLNGQDTGYTDSTHDCTQALWGPVTVSAVFAKPEPVVHPGGAVTFGAPLVDRGRACAPAFT